MKFETWSTPFKSGTIWLVDLSWGTKDGLVENFDSEAAWKDALSTIANCA